MGRVVALALVVAAATTATVAAAAPPVGAAQAPPAGEAAPPAPTGAAAAVAEPAGANPPAGASAPVGPAAVAYLPPVDAPVADAFRAPASPYGAGNRGVDYTTAPGTPVRASAAGQVSFAGSVAGSLHVVVLHADGLRTSYSFLASVAVRRGQAVEAGDTVGTTATSLHFGARAGDAYLDPLVLLAARAGASVRLVADDQRAMGSEAAERRGVLGVLRRATGAVTGVAAETASWAVGTGSEAVAGVVSAVPTAEQVRAWGTALASVAALPVRVTGGTLAWWARRDGCTPPGVVPPPVSGRRRVVLVAGLGSTSGTGAIDEVDTAGLGYADADRVRFSYRGGTTGERSYDAADTQVDIRDSGRRLRELLERMHAEDPGVPIDVIAHSQGGMVARAALGTRAPPGVATLTTLASPHQGADLATAIALVRQSFKGNALMEALSRLGLSGIDPTSTSVAQLAETSDFVSDLNSRPLPEGVRFTSVGARADVVVPAPRTHLPGASNIVVSVPDVNDHSSLPGSDVAHREIALGRAGMAPTCESWVDFVLDSAVGELIGTAEDVAGVTGGLGAWR